MSAARRRPRAFGGGGLSGDRWMRGIYVDEAGISAQDKIAVVAGIIVDADRQWKNLERRLSALTADLSQGHTGVFHGTALYSGGKDFPRPVDVNNPTAGEYTKEQRWAILERLVALPRELMLPIVVGYWIKDLSIQQDKRRLVGDHALAYMMCLLAANLYMKHFARADEIANIVAEDNTQARTHIRKCHNGFFRLAGNPGVSDYLKTSSP